jgi:hypothetical protein
MTFAHKDEWSHFIEQEEGEMMVLDFIEDTIVNCQKVIFAKQIDIQILPFTVKYAHEFIKDIIHVRTESAYLYRVFILIDLIQILVLLLSARFWK